MITLKTLPQVTAQEVFDQVARHLLTQKERSQIAESRCAYRGEDGLMCAAGCLLDDEEYLAIEKHNMSSWLALTVAGKVPHAHAKLISDLQKIHDGEDAEYWSKELEALAQLYDLSPAVLEEFADEPS